MQRVFAILVAVAAIPFISGAAPETHSTSTKLFKGITLHQLVATSPRAMKINVVEIDLREPGIRFHMTPANGKQPGETTLQTTRDFLVEQHAQVAINASFYSIVETDFGNTSGFTASDGDAYSEFTTLPAINISRTNVPTFITQAKRDQSGVKPAQNVEIFNAVSGNEMIVHRGKNVAEDQRLHPRTALGIAPGPKLFLLTADGRQPLISEGATTPELADVLLSFGVTEAINLDGGGSTTMAIADPSPRLVNTPVGIRNIPGSQRRNATNLAVFAQPLDETRANSR